MQKPLQSRAERYFPKSQNKESQLHADRERERRETLKQMAKLRALRLAVEAADEKTAREATSVKRAAVKKKAPPG